MNQILDLRAALRAVHIGLEVDDFAFADLLLRPRLDAGQVRTARFEDLHQIEQSALLVVYLQL